MAGYRYLILDLDGTLADPSPGISRAIRSALADVGRPIDPETDLRWCIGPPLRTYFPRLLGSHDPELIEAAVARYRHHYAAGALFETMLYPGALETLEALSRHDYVLFVASSKAQPFLGQVIEHLGVSGYFRGVYGPDQGGALDDKVELIRHLLVQERIPTPQTVMIGDRDVDVRAGLVSRLATVAVTWGFGSHEELRAARPDALVASFGELLELLAT